MTIATRTLGEAGYLQSIDPGPSSTGGYVVGWYLPGSSPQRAEVYATSPGYVVSATASSFSNAQTYLLNFLRGVPLSGFSKRTPAQTAVTTFGTALTAYQSAVRDVAVSGSQWRAPFPETVASRWRNLLSAYAVAWTVSRGLAAQVLNSQGSPNTYVPPSSIQTQAVNPKLTVTSIATLPPEVQAQIVGTQPASISPNMMQGAPSGMGPAESSRMQAQYAAQTSTAAGDPLTINAPGYSPSGGSLADYRDPTRTIIHTPLYKEPSFWVAVAGGAAFLGVTYYLVKKSTRGFHVGF